MCFLFGHGQGVQPDENTTRTNPALNMTQLLIGGEAGWFLIGLNMAGMGPQCCPVMGQDGLRSQVTS